MDETKSVNKKNLRKEMLKRRSELTANYKSDASDLICDTIISSEAFKKAKNVYLYSAVNSEVCVDKIFKAGILLGKNMFFPRCEEKGIMHFYRINSFGELVAGKYNILEPDKTCERCEVFDGIMIIPGVAFDEKCNRLGYGGGYYDRYTGAVSSMTYIAVCFEAQIIKNVPTEEHDKRPDYVITEKNIYRKDTYV